MTAIEPDWEIAACREYDPDTWFPEAGRGKTNDWRTPKTICGGCEIRDDCLAYAIATDQRYGVWGGVSERARRDLITANRKARP